MGAAYFDTGLYTSTYFLFEAAFASVTFALAERRRARSSWARSPVLDNLLRADMEPPGRMDMEPDRLAVWKGVRDFAGGLVVHAAAGAAGLALVLQIWREERKRGLRESPQVPVRVSSGWLALSVLLLWIGWFGFNAGSVLAFTSSALAVVITTFLAASSCLARTMAAPGGCSTGRPRRPSSRRTAS